MANLQAVGFDGETIIYLLAEGAGTDLDPFVSKFTLVDQDLLATDAGLTAIADLIPEFTFDEMGRLSVVTGLDLSGLATKSKQDDLLAKIPNNLTVEGDQLKIKTELSQPLTLAELSSIVVATEEQSPLDLEPLAKESKQDDLIAKLPDGLTVIDGKLQTKPDIQFPSSYELGGNSLAALENITVEIDKTGLATESKQNDLIAKFPDQVNSRIPVDITRSERIYTRFRSDISTSGDNQIIAAQGSGKSIYIAELTIVNKSNNDTLALLKEGATIIGDVPMPSKGDGIVLAYDFDSEWKLPVNTALVANLSGNNNVSLWGRYRVV